MEILNRRLYAALFEFRRGDARPRVIGTCAPPQDEANEFFFLSFSLYNQGKVSKSGEEDYKISSQLEDMIFSDTSRSAENPRKRISGAPRDIVKLLFSDL